MDAEHAVDRETLTEVVIEALERMAFVLVDECEGGGAGDGAGLEEAVEIVFSRESDGEAGTVWIRANEAFARELGGSLLGEEAEDVDLDGVGRPALLELANVLGGEVVRLLGGATTPFKLGLPSRSAGAMVTAADDVAVHLETDESGRIDVCVRLSPALVGQARSV